MKPTIFSSSILPTTAIFLILSVLTSAQNFCFDHPNPLNHRERVAVPCPIVEESSPLTTKSVTSTTSVTSRTSATSRTSTTSSSFATFSTSSSSATFSSSSSSATFSASSSSVTFSTSSSFATFSTSSTSSSSSTLSTSTPTARHDPPTLRRRDQISYNGTNFFQINLSCRTDSVTCTKATNAFRKAGEIISGVIIFNTPVIVNASFYHFCQEIGDCGNNGYVTLGGSYPARTIPMQDSDGIGRFYPQALVKQLGLKSHPQYGPNDISSMFNADAPFFFEEDGDITPTQSDFLFVILHEFMHGLGFISNWNDYINQTPQALTPDITPLDTGDPSVQITPDSQVTFQGFYESAFDRFMVTLPDLKPTSQFTRVLNAFNGGIGTKYAAYTVFFQYFVTSPQYQSSLQMYNISTTGQALGFLPQNATSLADAIILETTLSPFAEGSSISHVDYNTYTNTSDFLMRYMQDRGVTLEDAVTSGGGGPIGPQLIRVLESLGYATVNNPNPPRDVTTIPTGSKASQPIAAAPRNRALEAWGKLGIVLGVVIVLVGW